MTLNFRKYLNWVSPKYNELTAFLTAFICLLLLFTYPEFSDFFSQSFDTPSAKADLWVLTIWIGTIGGFFLSFIHVFTNRPKSYLEKILMGLFALGANGIAGIVAGFEILPNRWSIWVCFPIWNLISSYLLFYQLGLQKDVISDDDASLLDVFITSIVLLIIFFLAVLKFHLSWALTFSICMFYTSILTTILTKAIHYFLFTKQKRVVYTAPYGRTQTPPRRRRRPRHS